MYPLPGLPEVHTFSITRPGFLYRPGYCTIVRNIRQSDVQQCIRAALYKCGTLQGCEEDFSAYSLIPMIDNAILIGISGCDLRMSRRQTGPYFRTDKTSAGIFIDIVHHAGHRRDNSRTQIRLPHPILYPIGNHIRQPVFSQDLRVDIPTILLYRRQPDDLQIQVIIRRRPCG